MENPKLGRPRAKLKKATSTVTRRVRRLIDVAHDGNVQAASRATGLPYPTVRDLYLGRSTNPSLKTLRALAETYSVFEGWFSDEAQQESIPLGGFLIFLPALDGATDRRKRRESVIPFAAWTMKVVAERLNDALETLSPHSSRPIVGEATDEELNFRLSSFLFRPFLEIELATGRAIIPTRGSDKWHDESEMENWITRLRFLGNFWESVMDEVVSAIQKNVVSRK
jgi:transcriptional regulator with XRE-family HTH domain